MVTPAPKRPRRTHAIAIAVAATTFLVACSVGIFLTSLTSRTSRANNIRSSSLSATDGNKPQSEKSMQHLSAKTLLATGRPYLVYGTAWKKEDTANLVSQAIHAGFRFFDTACQPKHYNEAGVGLGWTKAASQLGLNRSDIFLQTKFTAISGQDPENIPYDTDATLEDQVRQSLTESLQNLLTDYIDSLVLHSPMSTMEETIRVWRVFESFVTEGKVRQLGISNCYNFRDFRTLYQEATVKPAVVQNRFYQDSRFDVQLREICNSYGVKYQSFWTLTANKKALASNEWKDLAKEKGLTPQTLMYAFMMTLGHTPLDGTRDVKHMAEDVEVMLRIQKGELILSKLEVKKLKQLLGMHK